MFIQIRGELGDIENKLEQFKENKAFQMNRKTLNFKPQRRSLKFNSGCNQIFKNYPPWSLGTDLGQCFCEIYQIESLKAIIDSLGLVAVEIDLTMSFKVVALLKELKN